MTFLSSQRCHSDSSLSPPSLESQEQDHIIFMVSHLDLWTITYPFSLFLACMISHVACDCFPSCLNPPWPVTIWRIDAQSRFLVFALYPKVLCHMIAKVVYIVLLKWTKMLPNLLFLKTCLHIHLCSYFLSALVLSSKLDMSDLTWPWPVTRIINTIDLLKCYPAPY